MNKQELQALIDRVIGTKGIMRSSAWWVRKLFNEVVGYLEKYAESYANNAVKKVKITSDTEMSDESTNPVQNKVIKAYVDSSKEIKVVRMAAKSSCELSPNIYYYWGDNTRTNEMAVTLLDYVQDYTGETLKTYTLDFRAGASCVLTFNADLQWEGGSQPTYKEGQRYQINIKGRYASVISSDESPAQTNVKKLRDEIVENESVIAAALTDLDTRITDIIARLDSAGL